MGESDWLTTVPMPEFIVKSQANGYGDFMVQTDDTVGRVLARHRDEPALAVPAVLLATLVVTQFVLGAATVWTGKAVIPTTFHVLNGALVLVTSLVLALRSFKHVVPEHRALAYRPLPTERVAT